MAVLASSKKTRVKLNMGEEDVIMIYNTPSTEVQSAFLKSRWPSKRNKQRDNSFEARISFSKANIFDIENAVYENDAGEIKPLNNSVENWADKINPSWHVSGAMFFEEKESEEDAQIKK